MKTFALAAIVAAQFLFACHREADDLQRSATPPTKPAVSISDLTRFLSGTTGVTPDKIVYQTTDELFVIDNDMLISKAEAEKYYQANQANQGARTEHWRGIFLVADSYVRNIKVFIQAGVPADWCTATRNALSQWNAINGTKIYFTEVSSSTTADITVRTGFEAGASWIANADLPFFSFDGGRPGNPVTINTYHNGLPASQKLFAMIHELGHTFGLLHTNQTQGFFISGTPSSDPNSVMNSFVLNWSGFTNGDVSAVQILYPGSIFTANESWTTEAYYGSRGTYFTDVTGDGKADAIVVNEDGITVRRSNGSQFLGYESWTTNPYYGSRGTYFADVTGDGKADAIVVNEDGITVRRADGGQFLGNSSQFLGNESWTTEAYYGSRETYFADVTGDGKADAIVVNEDGVTVRRSNGSQFLGNESWTSEAYYGSRGTYFADVSGDGKADAIVVNEDGITVRRSDASQFSGNESWTSEAYYGSRGTYFADVTGDGKADAIVVNEDGVTIRRSNGSQFSGNESWTSEAYYGSRGTYFADVTGGGKADGIVVNEDGITVRRSED